MNLPSGIGSSHISLWVVASWRMTPGHGPVVVAAVSALVDVDPAGWQRPETDVYPVVVAALRSVGHTIFSLLELLDARSFSRVRGRSGRCWPNTQNHEPTELTELTVG
jgi:hypothetical protein